VPPHPLSSQCRHHLFLAVHEAFTNILKHSGATEAKVSVGCDSAVFEIVVSDNGKGFDTRGAGVSLASDASLLLGSQNTGEAPGEQAAGGTRLAQAACGTLAPTPSSGNGLRNMRQRLAKLGGFCQVESAPGRGATIRFVLPLSQLSHKANS
jgi:signal transduction histidine kinase